jgi:prepilin peptidase CpaA
MSTQIFIYGVLLAGLVVAGITDVQSSRVPNLLTFPLSVVGLLFHAFSSEGQGILFSLEGLGLGLALLLIFYSYGGMGAGDVKLLAAIGAVVGPSHVFIAFLFTALLGGLYAFAMMMWHLGVSQTAERIKVLFVSLIFMRVNVASSLDQTPLPKLRYALVIGLGTLFGQGYEWFQNV